MNLLKTLGLGMYYRLRRIVKAVKNWKKFGVIIFGSILLATGTGNLPARVADATGNLSYLYVDPAAISVEAGQNYQFSYRAYDGDWQPLTVAATWSMNQPQAGSIDANGKFTAGTATGTYNNAVKLTAGALSAYARVVVLEGSGTTPPPASTSKLTYLYVDPAAISVEMGHSYTFKYKAYDQDWKPMTVPVTWSMGKPQAGAVDNGGNFTASYTKGTYENAVKVASGALSAYARVVVYGNITPPPAPVCSIIRITQPTNPIYVGENRVIPWSAKNSDDTNVPANKVGWTLTGGGTWNAATSTFSATQVGNFILTGYCTENPSVSTSVVLQIRMREVPPTETCASIDIWAQNLTLYRNNQVTIGYTALTNYGQPVSNGDLLWNWTGGAFNTGTKVYTATQVGDFTLTARCRLNPSISDSVAIHVSELIIQEDYLNSTDIWADRTSLCLNEIANLSAQARNNHGQVISDATYTWTWSGVGYLTGDTHSQYGARYASSNTPGWATVTVTASWHGQSVSNSIMMQVRDCTPVPSPYFIDGSIVATTSDGQPACTDSLVDYVVTLTNRYATVHNARLSLVLPTGVTLLSTTSAVDNPRVSGRTIFWEPGTLAQGQSVILRIQVSVNDDIQMGSNLKVNAFVQADEKPNGFYLYSNDLWVRCGGPTPEPLPPTGASAWILAGLAVISLGLAGLTYYLLDRRMANKI